MLVSKDKKQCAAYLKDVDKSWISTGCQGYEYGPTGVIWDGSEYF